MSQKEEESGTKSSCWRVTKGTGAWVTCAGVNANVDMYLLLTAFLHALVAFKLFFLCLLRGGLTFQQVLTGLT